MADDTLTSSHGPAATQTPEQEPGSPAPGESSPAPSQPTLEELQAKLTRLEANVSGSTKEWQREKTERERLEREIVQLRSGQQQARQEPGQQLPSDEDLAEAESNAIVAGNHRELARVRQIQRQKIHAETFQALSGVAQAQQIQNAKAAALNGYLAQRGFDPKSDLATKARERLDEVIRTRDPAYGYAFDSPEALAAIVFNEVRAETATAIRRDEHRQAEVDDSHTERSAGSGHRPGSKTTDEKMHFTPGEMRQIEHNSRRDGIGLEAAKKKYWGLMPEGERVDRQRRGGAR